MKVPSQGYIELVFRAEASCYVASFAAISRHLHIC